MTRIFHPSNGTEWMMFTTGNCDKCWKEKNCPLIVAGMFYEPRDPKYPTEWTEEDFRDPSTWHCSKLETRRPKPKYKRAPKNQMALL